MNFLPFSEFKLMNGDQPACMGARPRMKSEPKIEVPPRYEIIAIMDVPGCLLADETQHKEGDERLMQIRILRHVPMRLSSAPRHILVEQTDGVDAMGNRRWRTVGANYHLIHVLAVEYVRLKAER